ncbi:hypothetical protein AJ78_01148 [Emergomyces pasteurianus Ep9510]|uniref:Uncharacterized protein n=1 Tax=Emergomyces pasteurianus Ep9510 TaxID=1447872 RepID=A0A1J9QUF3_9EURO|nr:hypothetical protein AJ78_01148 [Emergomyces pasteurianus Ep9510]
MESSLPGNIHNNEQISRTESVKTGDKADEILNCSKKARTRRRVTFTLPSIPFGCREKHNGNGISPAMRRAAERVNLLLPKVASLTGAIPFQPPRATTESSRRRHSYAPQASRDYGRCILDLSVCKDDESQPDDELDCKSMNETPIHPLRMHPVINGEQHCILAGIAGTGTNGITREPEIASVAETIWLASTNDNTDSSEERSSGENTGPHFQVDAANDSGSDTSSLYSVADWFPFLELSQISWRTADSTSADESLPTTPKSPYRMGRSRRYGWVEGQSF